MTAAQPRPCAGPTGSSIPVIVAPLLALATPPAFLRWLRRRSMAGLVLLLLLVALLNREQQAAQENPEKPGNLPASIER